MLSRKTLMFFALLALVPAFAGTSRYRATWRDNPSTTMVIGWDQLSGNSPVLYYDTVDHGTNTGAYAFQHGSDRSVSYKGMSNQFARLSGLSPNTLYYFVIADSDSTSTRMKFLTASDDNSPFTVLAGGDSRNNLSVRIDANRMAAKLKPLFIMFGGDMTSGDSSSEWMDWFDHWQETITSDDRLIPVVAARGNHEGSNASISSLFDSPQANIYFALTFGADLLRTYTLNSEDVEGGNQASWLASDLASHQNISWRFGQYHKPMRPHVSSKSEGNNEYNAWAQLFFDYKMQLVVESDSHMVKSTWPLRPSSGSGSSQGFIRDDANGTVYVGEGTWGAPLRSADDSKSWTRESGSFNQFKWLEVSPNQVQIKTVQYDNVASVGEVSVTNAYTPPTGIQFWGSVIQLTAATAPSVSLTNPANGTLYGLGDTVSIGAEASSPSGSVASVRFDVDGATVATDTSAPYSASWTAAGAGSHTISATVTDDVGETVQDSVSISVGTSSITAQVTSSSDDAEEKSSGSVGLTSTDLELIRDGSSDQVVGIRFTGLQIPAGATINDASIQFTTDETGSTTTNVVIYAQNTGNAPTFTTSNGSISARPVTSTFVNWSPAAWNVVGQSGAAQKTPDLSSVVQEVVDRGDWAPGNAMVFLIDGTGKRTAESYNGSSSSAAKLTVSFSSGGGTDPGGNTAPNASFSFSINALTASFSNESTDADGSIASSSWNFGDGNSSSAQNPSHTYAASGTYNVTLTATDNEGATNNDTQSVTATGSCGGSGGEPNLSDAQGNWKYYSIDVPACATNFTAVITGGSGDADLYTRLGSQPTTSSYSCRPWRDGNEETCSVTNPTAGTWYVGVRAYSAYSGVTLTIQYQ